MQQAITWANGDPDPYHYMASLGPNPKSEWKFQLSQALETLWNFSFASFIICACDYGI